MKQYFSKWEGAGYYASCQEGRGESQATVFYFVCAKEDYDINPQYYRDCAKQMELGTLHFFGEKKLGE